MITALHLEAIVSQYVLNAASLFVQKYSFNKDLAYRHWSEDNKSKVSKAVVVLSTVVSYKAVRFLTSELFQKKCFYAVIEDKYR